MKHTDADLAYEAAILADALQLPAHDQGLAERSGIPLQRIGDWTQIIDLYARPGNSGPRPAIICVHGGGWQTGGPADFRRLARRLAWHHEVVVASVSYRFHARAGFPAPIHDVANSVRWLRTHAAHLGIDPTRIGMLGSSAGAYLTAMVALTHGDPGLAGGGAINAESAAVQAIVAQWGPLDFIARWYGNGGAPGAEAGLLGCTYTDHPTLYHAASALSHVHAAAPPALFIHGQHDEVVHPQQGELALAAWRRAGVPAELLRLAWVGHGEQQTGDIEAAQQATIAFLVARLAIASRPVSG